MISVVGDKTPLPDKTPTASEIRQNILNKGSRNGKLI